MWNLTKVWSLRKLSYEARTRNGNMAALKKLNIFFVKLWPQPLLLQCHIQLPLVKGEKNPVLLVEMVDFGEKVLQLYQVRIESVLEFSELGCNMYFCQVNICELIKIKLIVKELTKKGHYICILGIAKRTLFLPFD